MIAHLKLSISSNQNHILKYSILFMMATETYVCKKSSPCGLILSQNTTQGVPNPDLFLWKKTHNTTQYVKCVKANVK